MAIDIDAAELQRFVAREVRRNSRAPERANARPSSENLPLEVGRPIGIGRADADGDAVRTPERPGALSRMSVRWQILITSTVVILVVAALSFLIVVLNARRAIEWEMRASLTAAQNYVREAISRVHVNVSGMRFLDELALDGTALRHARIIVIDTDRNRVKPSPPLHGEGLATTIPPQLIRPENPDAPPWFVSLLEPEPAVIEVPIIVASGRVGAVVVVGEPTEEISRIWDDIVSLGIIGLCGIASVLILLYAALGRILGPLAAVSNGLVQLETGEFGVRLPRPRGRELGIITDRFNALAERLAAVSRENSRLNHRLIRVQDDERQQVAHELHDEAGPCLFGMKATLRTVRRSAERLGTPAGAEILAEINDFAAIIDRLQTMNRRIFKRLRPMALGHVPLAELIGDIIADLARLAPELEIRSEIAPLASGYGDPVDLTVYRCIQEGLTNVVRHSGARCAVIRLKEGTLPGLPGPRGLMLSVSDDGRGISDDTPAGYGLSGIDERVRALGGRCAVRSRQSGGTTLSIEIPIEESASNPVAGG